MAGPGSQRHLQAQGGATAQGQAGKQVAGGPARQVAGPGPVPPTPVVPTPMDHVAMCEKAMSALLTAATQLTENMKGAESELYVGGWA